MSRQFLILVWQLVDHILKNLQRRPAVKLYKQVLFAPCDFDLFADGPASLGHDRIHNDISRQRETHGSGPVIFVVQIKRVLKRLRCPAGQAAEGYGSWECVVEPPGKFLWIEGKRIGQEDELRTE